jgi:hypothetical protein
MTSYIPSLKTTISASRRRLFTFNAPRLCTRNIVILENQGINVTEKYGVVSVESYRERINMVCGQNVELVNVNAGGS